MLEGNVDTALDELNTGLRLAQENGLDVEKYRIETEITRIETDFTNWKVKVESSTDISSLVEDIDLAKHVEEARIMVRLSGPKSR